MKIIKRSGVEVFFDSNKIVAAVQKANASIMKNSAMSRFRRLPIMWKWHVKT